MRGSLDRLLLLSGGVDSALCLKRYPCALAIGFDYGQEHLVELDYAAQLAARQGVLFQTHKLPTLPRIDQHNFAGRNAIMLSTAAAIAQTRRMKKVMIGCNLTDAQNFPDCRPNFLISMHSALQFAYGIELEWPLIAMTKKEVLQAAQEEGIEMHTTWSCYYPVQLAGRVKECGECLACKGRKWTSKPKSRHP